MDFDELLEEIKEQFEAFRALIVLDDKTMRRYAMSWGPQLVRRHTHSAHDSTLAGLWDCVTVDYHALADLTGESIPQVMYHFRMAQGLQIIYPDGSVANEVVRVLRKKHKEIVG